MGRVAGIRPPGSRAEGKGGGDQDDSRERRARRVVEEVFLAVGAIDAGILFGSHFTKLLIYPSGPLLSWFPETISNGKVAGFLRLQLMKLHQLGSLPGVLL